MNFNIFSIFFFKSKKLTCRLFTSSFGMLMNKIKEVNMNNLFERGM